MAYHHFVSIDDITKTLLFFLKPGGTLLIADLVRSQNTLFAQWNWKEEAGGEHGHHHHGHHHEAHHSAPARPHAHAHGAGHASAQEHNAPRDGHTDAQPAQDPERFPTPPPGVVVHHGGFEEPTIREMFERAGLADYKFVPSVSVTRNEKSSVIFIAHGIKPVGN